MISPRWAALTFVVGLMTFPPVLSRAGAAPLSGDPNRGAGLYETRCGACHSLDANRIGPAHRGVFGRRAGIAPGFTYSPALKASGLTWTAVNLDLWLTAPTKLVKGTSMGFRLGSAQERADVIAYLASPAAARRAGR